MRILLAEDSRVSQAIAVRILEKHGHTVRVANNGKQALAAFEGEAFDLILMDVLMPEMGGFEATARIREIEARSRHATCCQPTSDDSAPRCGMWHDNGGTENPRVPIIAMTAHDRKDDRGRCLEAGMDEYISKPVIAQKLFDIIEKFRPAESDAQAAIVY